MVDACQANEMPDAPASPKPRECLAAVADADRRESARGVAPEVRGAQ
jgi:hypothetical protein